MALCTRCIIYGVLGFAIAFGLIALLDLGVYSYFAYQVNKKYGSDLFTKRRLALEKVLADSKARMMIDPIAVYRRKIDEKLKKLR
jgi:hypothetical protein